MSDNKGFWSSVPGVVTGVASIVTATVGLVGAGVTLGWFGNKDNDKTVSSAATTTTTSALATTTTLLGRTSGTATTVSLSPLQAAPTTLTFDALGARDQNVTVRNTTASALTLSPPSVAGVDKGEFTAKDLTCGSRLDANRTCEVQVTYRATTAGTVNATLVLEPVGPPALEVPLKGNRLI